MSQVDLFAAAPHVLAEDGEGGIRYWPRFVGTAQAERWFAALRDEVEWTHYSRPMYDRVVDVPRLVSSLPLDGSKPLPVALQQAALAVSEGLGVAFTHVGMNHYRDGRDSVAPHNDKLKSLVPGHPIALLSLGATRRMDIREKEPSGIPPKRRGWRLDLEAGSVLVMSHASQKTFDHGIPKTTAQVGPRISLAFRVRPAGGHW
ncbi:MAG TPA: alpha-ketoglutarate-dependent dioxygenase AlkB [Luteimonas sp.]|nr:alpha-ketoglutarate-dependent dioxygenase AlkB [Luteimonas sp.]